MLDRQRGQFIFECDVCGDTLETEQHNFEQAKTALDAAEWKARKIGSEWIHYCGDCGERDRRN